MTKLELKKHLMALKNKIKNAHIGSHNAKDFYFRIYDTKRLEYIYDIELSPNTLSSYSSGIKKRNEVFMKSIDKERYVIEHGLNYRDNESNMIYENDLLLYENEATNEKEFLITKFNIIKGAYLINFDDKEILPFEFLITNKRYTKVIDSIRNIQLDILITEAEQNEKDDTDTDTDDDTTINNINSNIVSLGTAIIKP